MVGRISQAPRTATPTALSRRRRARWLVPIAVAAAISTALAACSSSSGGSNSNSSTTFTYAMTGLPTSLDPANYQGDPSRDIGYEEGSALFQWNTAVLPSAGCDSLPSVGNITGELAKSYTRSADGKTITVTLNDAKSSAGNELTADDVKWTIDRLIALKVATPITLMTGVAHWDPTNPITVVDARTFEIHLRQQTAMDLAILTWPQFRILDSTEVKKHVTSDDPWGTKFLDTTSANFGPWENSSADFDPGSKLTMHVNPNYTGSRGDVTTLVMESVPDASTRTELLQTGNADFAANLSYTQYASLKSASNVDVQVCASANRETLMLNAKNPTLAKPDVRRAISMAIDRDALVKGATAGFNQPSKYGLSQSYKFTPAADGRYTYDVAGAKALMQRAGVKPFTLTLIESPARPGPEADQIAILLQSELAQIGITVKIQTQASATDLNTTFHDGNYDAMIYLEPPAISDPYYSLYLYNSSTSSLDTFNYKNTQFDSLVAQIATTPPGTARDALITKAAEIVVTDPPAIYLIDNQFVHAVSKSWTNYQHPPSGEVMVYELKKA